MTSSEIMHAQLSEAQAEIEKLKSSPSHDAVGKAIEALNICVRRIKQLAISCNLSSEQTYILQDEINTHIEALTLLQSAKGGSFESGQLGKDFEKEFKYNWTGSEDEFYKVRSWVEKNCKLSAKSDAVDFAEWIALTDLPEETFTANELYIIYLKSKCIVAYEDKEYEKE